MVWLRRGGGGGRTSVPSEISTPSKAIGASRAGGKGGRRQAGMDGAADGDSIMCGVVEGEVNVGVLTRLR